MGERVQMRGNCQVCGRLQAADPRLSKHGYTVENGWFNGVCPGAGFDPIQASRGLLDRIMVDILRDCDQIEAHALKIEQGKYTPETIVVQEYRKATRWSDEQPEVRKGWADADEDDRDRWKRIAIIGGRQRAKGGRDHVAMMRELADRVHGQPRVEVKVRTTPLVHLRHGNDMRTACFQRVRGLGMRSRYLDCTDKMENVTCEKCRGQQP